MNSTWVQLSSQVIHRFYHISKKYAENTNHHFYAQNHLEMDTFRLIGFNLDNSQDGWFELRFWTLEDDLLTPKHKILDDIFSGYITLYQNEAQDFIALAEE